jgi:hypothetical protein
MNENIKNKITATENLRKDILSKIESGAVAMKPKWHFALHAITLAVALIAVGLLTLFIARSLFFYVRVSEIAELTGFGPRGWSAFIRHFPWAFLASDIALIIAIVLGVRHFRSGSRIPAISLAAAFLMIAGILGFALDRVHFGPRYVPRRPPVPPGAQVCRCEVKAVDRNIIIANDTETGREYNIIIPPGEVHANSTALKSGDHIFVAGEEVGSGTIRAFGVRKRHSPHESFDGPRVRLSE